MLKTASKSLLNTAANNPIKTIIFLMIAYFLIFKRFSMSKILSWPVEGRISSKFGLRKDPLNPSKMQGHNGIDIAAVSGTFVKAPMDGKISSIFVSDLGGNQMTIEHPDGFKTGYAHLKELPNFSKGMEVKKGSVIALVGNTGSHTTGAHLHFTVRKNGVLVDPLKYLV